jgi:hypothetical protein
MIQELKSVARFGSPSASGISAKPAMKYIFFSKNNMKIQKCFLNVQIKEAP